jgi:hypothetical protein
VWLNVTDAPTHLSDMNFACAADRKLSVEIAFRYPSVRTVVHSSDPARSPTRLPDVNFVSEQTLRIALHRPVYLLFLGRLHYSKVNQRNLEVSSLEINIFCWLSRKFPACIALYKNYLNPVDVLQIPTATLING